VKYATKFADNLKTSSNRFIFWIKLKERYCQNDKWLEWGQLKGKRFQYCNNNLERLINWKFRRRKMEIDKFNDIVENMEVGKEIHVNVQKDGKITLRLVWMVRC
jgi:hypothetical protein